MPTLPRTNKVSPTDNKFVPAEKTPEHQRGAADPHAPYRNLGSLATDPTYTPADDTWWIWYNTTSGELKVKLGDGTVEVLAPFAAPQSDVGSGTKTITTTNSAIESQLSLEDGTYFVFGEVEVEVTTAGTGWLRARFAIDAASQDETDAYVEEPTSLGTLVLGALLTISGGPQTVTIEVRKQNAGGAARVNEANAVIVAFIPAGAGAGGGGASDHGALTGLDDNDHGAIYYTETEVDALLAALDYAAISGNDGDTDVTGAELETLSDGSETTLHSHAGGGDVATDAIWDAAGDLAQGTGSNTAARLAPTQNAFLVYNGSTLLWDTSPPIASLTDTSGNTRIALAASSPNVTLTGNVKVSGVIAANNAPPNANIFFIGQTTSDPDGKTGLSIGMGISAPAAGAGQVIGVGGYSLMKSSATNVAVFGLDFLAGFQGVAGTPTIPLISVVRATPFLFDNGVTCTELNVFDANVGFLTTAGVTTFHGLYVRAFNSASFADYYGVRVANVSNPTGNIYGIYTDMVGTYALFIDAGLSRFDGDGTHIFELPADATDPTSGGGAAIGRVPVTIGGVTRHLAYY